MNKREVSRIQSQKPPKRRVFKTFAKIAVAGLLLAGCTASAPKIVANTKTSVVAENKKKGPQKNKPEAKGETKIPLLNRDAGKIDPNPYVESQIADCPF